MTGFRYLGPTTVEETVALLREHGDDATLLAGGQSLMILLRQRLVVPGVLVGLKGVTELQGVETHGSSIRVGSMVTYRSLARHPIAKNLGVLVAAAGSVGSVHIRNLGTIGGSLCHADPAGDLPTVLLMYGGILRLRTPDGGERTHAIDDFFTGLFETRREPGELLVAVEVAVQPADATYSYRRFSFREGEYPMCVVACRLDWDGDRCVGARVAVGGAGTHPQRLTEVEERLADATPTAELMASVAAEIRGQLQPVPDVRGTSQWKAKVVSHVLEDALVDALQQMVQHA